MGSFPGRYPEIVRYQPQLLLKLFLFNAQINHLLSTEILPAKENGEPHGTRTRVGRNKEVREGWHTVQLSGLARGNEALSCGPDQGHQYHKSFS